MGSDSNSSPLCWSHSRDAVLQECPRKYYLLYHAAPHGRRSGASPREKQAFHLAQLTTLEMALGSAIHLRAREIAAAIRDRCLRPGLSVLRDRTRAALNRLWADSWKRSPTGGRDRDVVLHAAYYGYGIGAEVIDRVRTRMCTCIQNLSASSIWMELGGCSRSNIYVIDRPLRFLLDGRTVWAAPDLVYRRSTGRLVVVDWKTGRTDDGERQLSLYALTVREALGISAEVVDGQISNLADGTDTLVQIGRADLASAEDRVRAGFERMLSYAAGAGDDAPKEMEAFPTTRHRGRCPRCNFWEICEPEIRGEVPGCSNSMWGSPADEDHTHSV